MSSSSGHFFSELLLIRQEFETYFNLASLTLLCYELALQLNLEVALVWQSRSSLVKFLYILTRYMAFADVTAIIYAQVAKNLSVNKCTALYAAFCWMFTVGPLLGESILFIRGWALWGRDFKVGVGLLTFYVGMSVAACVNMSVFLRGVEFADSIPGIPGCVVVGSASDRLYINWVLLMVLDIVVCLLMIVKGRASYLSGGNSQLMKVVYGEGVMYYAYMVVLSTITVILILKLPLEYISLLASPMSSVHAILTCRVVLHTRQLAVQDTVVLGDNSQTVYGLSTGEDMETLRFTGVRSGFD